LLLIGPRGRVALRTASRISTRPRLHLAPFHIDAHDLHLHPVAETVDPFRVLTLQRVLLLDKAVVVVAHARNVHQAFDEVLDELDEEAEGGHSGHVTLELLAHLVRHEADLLPLQQLTLRVIRTPLHLRGVAADFGQLLFQFLASRPGDRSAA
jgi:hypothetical protein